MRAEVVESWNDLQLVLTPLPGLIDLCTPPALVEAWLSNGRYHVSVTKKAHRIYQDRWWAIWDEIICPGLRNKVKPLVARWAEKSTILVVCKNISGTYDTV